MMVSEQATNDAIIICVSNLTDACRTEHVYMNSQPLEDAEAVYGAVQTMPGYTIVMNIQVMH